MKQRIVLLLVCMFGAAGAAPITAQAVNKPDWPLEVLSWDIDKAYPGIEYNYRVAVKGGEYPYQFTLVEGPSGMTINKKTGEILWTPASSLTDTVVVRISDMAGNSLVHQFEITSTKTGFYFVDAAKGSDTANTGSESSPWKTMKHASATADSSCYVYVKAGTYSESAFPIAAMNCGRFMAYPGDTVFVNSTSSGKSTISINGGSNRLFQGFNFDGNHIRWLFNVAGYTKNVIWRKNTMHNIYSTDSENPACMFFANGSGNPITGGNSHSNIVIQDNVFYDIGNSHSASVTCFDVKNMIYEDNVAYDIEGNGVNDKDMGYMNTIRNNVLYDCSVGIGLLSQGGQSGIEVCYNHVYNCRDLPIFVGLQSGYINNVFIHHNTFLGGIAFHRYEMVVDDSYNINVYNNIIGNGARWPYAAGSPDANYMSIFVNKVSVDRNVVFGPSDGSSVAGARDNSAIKLSWAQWQSVGEDINSKYMQLEYDSNHIPILPDSLKIYGHFGANTDVNHAPVLAPIGSRSVPVGQPLHVTVQATDTDADGDVLQFGASGGGR